MTKKLSPAAEQLIKTIMDYCGRHDMVLWSKKSEDAHLLYVSDHLAMQDNQADGEVHEIKHDKLSNGELLLDENGKMLHVLPWSQWLKSNNHHHAQLLVEVFWNTDKPTFANFSKGWINRSFNLVHAYRYTNSTYTKGFEDSQIVWHTTGLNWRHLMHSLPRNILVDFWNDEGLRRQFCKMAKTSKRRHSVCRPLVQKLFEENLFEEKEAVPPPSKPVDTHSIYLAMFMDIYEERQLSSDTLIDSAKLLMDVFDGECSLQQYYAKYFPFMDSLIKKKDRHALFQQDDSSRVEKMEVKIADIYNYFKDCPVKTPVQKRVGSLVLESFKGSEVLKGHGLLEMDIVDSNEKMLCYLSLSGNARINREILSKLFVQAMEECMVCPDVVNAKEDESGYFLSSHKDKVKSEVVNAICSRFLECWSLEQALPVGAKKASRKI